MNWPYRCINTVAEAFCLVLCPWFWAHPLAGADQA